MLDVQRLRPTQWSAYRELRLAALADAPDAFGNTLERARKCPDGWWRERLERAEPDTSHPLGAVLDGVPCALAWAVANPERADAAELFQMWVAPPARRRGVGRRLVDGCIDWAASRGRDTVALDCTLGNAAALRLYRRCGFVMTGESRPLRKGSGIVSVRMERRATPD